MKTLPIRKSRMLLAATLGGAVLLGGCQSGPSYHQKAVNNANNRWLSMRSTLILKMAQHRFETGDLDQSQKNVHDALQLDPTNPQLILLAGRIALERGQLERSYDLLAQSMKLDPKLPEPYYYQGLVLQRWQKYDLAYQRYTEAYERQADNAAYLLARAEMLVSLNRYDDAMELLQSKLIYFDQDAGIRAAIGHLYMMKAQPVQAVLYFKQAVLLNPTEVRLKEAMGLAQVAAKDYTEAVTTLKHLLQNDKVNDRQTLQRALAHSYVALAQDDEARAVLLDLVQSPTPSAGDWMDLGQLSWRDSDLNGALEAARRAIDLAPRDQQAYLLAGMVMEKRHQLGEALKMFSKAAELAPTSSDPLILRGLALDHAGQHVAAAAAYKQALARNPDDQRAKHLLAAMGNV